MGRKVENPGKGKRASKGGGKGRGQRWGATGKARERDISRCKCRKDTRVTGQESSSCADNLPTYRECWQRKRQEVACSTPDYYSQSSS